MKIGYDAKRFFQNTTGLGNYSRSLIKVLSDFYPTNEYLLFTPKKTTKFNLNSYNNSVVSITPTSFFKRIASLWRMYFISFAIKKHKVSIYHGLSGEIPLGVSKKIKKVVTIHDLIFIRYPNLYSFFDRKIHFSKFKYAAKNADIVVAISEQTKKDIVNFLKIPANKIKVIYQGCGEVFKQVFTEDEKYSTVKKYNLPEKYILNVGTIEKRKNLLLLLKAITNSDKHIVVIGKKTSYYKEINHYIIENNLEKQVHFLKNISSAELAMLYQKAYLFIYPSIFEGFGIPIIEALYSKTPVITSSGSCFSEAGGVYSIYINPEDANALKNAINSVWNNDEKIELMKQKGFEFVQQFNDDVIAKKWITLYESLL